MTAVRVGPQVQGWLRVAEWVERALVFNSLIRLREWLLTSCVPNYRAAILVSFTGSLQEPNGMAGHEFARRLKVVPRGAEIV